MGEPFLGSQGVLPNRYLALLNTCNLSSVSNACMDAVLKMLFVDKKQWIRIWQ